MKRVCIIGAGAIGGWLGARLASAGCEVSVVGRGETLKALRANGLRLEEATQTLSVPVRATDDTASLGVQDLVILSVKAPALSEVARTIPPLIGPETVVLTAMNGVPWWFLSGFGGAIANTRLTTVDPEGAIERAIPTEHVIGCVVHASCSLNAAGFVKHHFGNELIIGEVSGGESSRGASLGALLAKAGYEATVTDCIQKDIWYKLWGNMTVNPVSALTRATTDLILDDELVRGLMSRVMLEAREIGNRIGIPLSQEPEDRHNLTRKLGAFKSSMLQDVEAGKPVELDALVGVVRELGVLTGVATPFLDGLFGLSRLALEQKKLYWPR